MDDVAQRTWKPYPEPSSNNQSMLPKEGIPFPIHACTAANISLCEIMRRINTTL
jgi:hypothetical protein